MFKLIIANWKQNMNQGDINAWFEEFVPLIQEEPLNNVSFIIAPSYPYLPILYEYKLSNTSIFASGQDVSLYNEGAHTEKVGATQLRDFCEYCIVGHSETGDSFEDAVKKADLCLNNALTPILCFVNPENVTSIVLQGVVLAMEDPTNISQEGSYNAKDPLQVEGAIKDIKGKLQYNTQLVYGGSVNRQNAEALGNINELDGVLIGHASLDPQHFYDIAKAFDKEV